MPTTTNNNNLEVTSWADYYPFGETMPGRSLNANTHLYGYQGQEKAGNGSNWYNFQLRMYNPSLGRWSTIDPYAQHYSPYLAMGNNPISRVDPDGGKDKVKYCDGCIILKPIPPERQDLENVELIPFDIGLLDGGSGPGGLHGGASAGVTAAAASSSSGAPGGGSTGGTPASSSGGSNGGSNGGNSGGNASSSNGRGGGGGGLPIPPGSPPRQRGSIGGAATSIAEMLDNMSNSNYRNMLWRKNRNLAKTLIRKINQQSAAASKINMKAQAIIVRNGLKQYKEQLTVFKTRVVKDTERLYEESLDFSEEVVKNVTEWWNHLDIEKSLRGNSPWNKWGYVLTSEGARVNGDPSNDYGKPISEIAVGIVQDILGAFAPDVSRIAEGAQIGTDIVQEAVPYINSGYIDTVYNQVSGNSLGTYFNSNGKLDTTSFDITYPSLTTDNPNRK